MKFIKEMKNWGLIVTISLFVSATGFAQEATPTPTPQKRERITGNPKVETKTEPTETPKTEPTPVVENTPEPKSEPTPETKTENKNTSTIPTLTPTETSDDESTKEVVSYYVNYLREYRLGPEDVISVEVFGKPQYSKAGITIPPTATISYNLIPGGVFVAGKTTDQVGQEIAKKLSEYIINPQVTVNLEKVGSARYAVMGDVVQPGIRLMTRRVTVMSALTEAGGVLPTGSKSKIVIYRNSGAGMTQIAVNLDSIMKNKEKDVDLQPGDQVFIPGNKMKSFLGVVDIVSRLSGFRMFFGGPF